MGQSLAEAAVRGVTPASLSDEAQELLDRGDIAGLLRLRKAQFGGWFMERDDDADDDDDDSDDEDEDDDDDDGDDDEDDDDSQDRSKRKRKPDPKDRRIQELSGEAKRYRLKSVARGKRVAELEAEIAKLKKGSKAKTKSKDDDDDDEDKVDVEETEEFKELKQSNEKLARNNEDLLIRLEFMGNTKYEWKNPRAALRLLDLSDVEIDDDGEVEGLDEAIDALAKSDPYLLKGKDDDDEDEDDEDEKPKSRRTGHPPSRRRKKANANADKLKDKYPALRR